MKSTCPMQTVKGSEVTCYLAPSPVKRVKSDLLLLAHPVKGVSSHLLPLTNTVKGVRSHMLYLTLTCKESQESFHLLLPKP